MLQNAAKKLGNLSTSPSVESHSSLKISHIQSMTWDKVTCNADRQTKSKRRADSKTSLLTWLPLFGVSLGFHTIYHNRNSNMKLVLFGPHGRGAVTETIEGLKFL